jgi:hypothetical protein
MGDDVLFDCDLRAPTRGPEEAVPVDLTRVL